MFSASMKRRIEGTLKKEDFNELYTIDSNQFVVPRTVETGIYKGISYIIVKNKYNQFNTNSCDSYPSLRIYDEKARMIGGPFSGLAVVELPNRNGDPKLLSRCIGIENYYLFSLDYNTDSDFTPLNPAGKKYKVKEIVEDAKAFIDEIERQNKEYKKDFIRNV